jgi:hypothetical protein
MSVLFKEKSIYRVMITVEPDITGYPREESNNGMTMGICTDGTNNYSFMFIPWTSIIRVHREFDSDRVKIIQRYIGELKASKSEQVSF